MSFEIFYYDFLHVLDVLDCIGCIGLYWMYWMLFLLVRHSTVEVPNYLEYVFHCNIFNLVHYYLACVYLKHYVTS